MGSLPIVAERHRLCVAPSNKRPDKAARRVFFLKRISKLCPDAKITHSTLAAKQSVGLKQPGFLPLTISIYKDGVVGRPKRQSCPGTPRRCGPTAARSVGYHSANRLAKASSGIKRQRFSI